MTTPAHDVEPQPIREYGVAPRGYRLPDATRLGRVHLQIADLARSIEYYERVLGLRTLSRGEGVASLGGPDGHALLELRERRGATPVPRRGRLGLYHFAILLPDRAALGRFLYHLGQLGIHAGMSDHLVSEAIYLTDPDGLGIEVYADRPREAWKHANRQLAMATDALDVQSVLMAGAGQPWTGVPVGTVMGHVHLFVDDLERAAAFYHDAVGFDKVVWSYPGALFMSAGGYHHHLGTNTWAQGAPRAAENDARMLEWTIALPSAKDVDEVGASLQRAGFATTRDGGDLLTSDNVGVGLRLSS